MFAPDKKVKMSHDFFRNGKMGAGTLHQYDEQDLILDQGFLVSLF
jgi:hypothetical protein